MTEKLAGGNLTFTRDEMYARSLDSGTPPWDRPAKALWAMTAHRIPDDWRVCGESMWAQHTNTNHKQPNNNSGFGIWDETDTLLGWDDSVYWAERLVLPVGPVPYRGGSLTEARAAWAAQRDAETSEGYVVRTAGRLPAAEFSHKVLKWVRADHVRTEASWRHRDDFAVNEFA